MSAAQDSQERFYKSSSISIAIFGDCSHYTSKPLKDFIYESDQGKDIFFVSTRDEAIEKLTK